MKDLLLNSSGRLFSSIFDDSLKTRDIFTTNNEAFTVMQHNHDFENNMFDAIFTSQLKSFFNYSNRFRRTGRTHLLAKILLELAIESGEPVNIFDHTEIIPGMNNRMSSHHILGLIRQHIDFYINNGVILDILRFDAQRIHIRLGYEYSNAYHKLRIPDFEITSNNNYLLPKKNDTDELLLICDIC